MAIPEMRELNPTGEHIPSDGELLGRAVTQMQSLQAENEVLRDALDVALRLLDGEGIHAERVDRLAAVLRGEQ